MTCHNAKETKLSIPVKPTTGREAYQEICSELEKDCRPCLNLATFVTTEMDTWAEQLLLASVDKNFVDHFQYPSIEAIDRRVISMIAGLFHGRIPAAMSDKDFIGSTTVGSSEAIILSLLAHKWNWKNRNQDKAKHYKPILIMGGNVHTSWVKFSVYFDVDIEWIELEKDLFHVTAEQVKQKLESPCSQDPHFLVGDLAMAVGCVLGSTYTGQMDKIQEINQVLEGYVATRGWEIPIHVDAAFGGFIVPFNDPDLAWDFRLSHVLSINVSNHKSGNIYVGMGSVLFRHSCFIPPSLIFPVDYLGGNTKNYSFNFSRPSSPILLQYYNFLRLGREGYQGLVGNMMKTTNSLVEKLSSIGVFRIISDVKHFPVVVLEVESKLFALQLSRELQKFGWIVPAYSLAKRPADSTNSYAFQLLRCYPSGGDSGVPSGCSVAYGERLIST